MKTIYPDVFEKVLLICDQYIANECTPRKVQEIIGWAESSIQNFEEKDLREFFTVIESDIDFVRVMANEADFEYRGIPEIENKEEMLKIVHKIKTELINRQ